VSQLFKLKSLDQMIGDAEHGAGHLKRALGPWQLTVLGVGAIIGAGIFSTIGTAAAGGGAHLGAGPAIVISFILTAIACGFAAL
jgi:basic amino acid/polyamine antiporter, APA family